MKKKWEKNWIAPLLLLLLVAICLLTVVLRSNQSSLSKPFPQTITGEYSRDGETWYPLDDNADLDALNGDLFLRGHFSYDIFDGGRLYYYQNHIGVTIYLNGELLFFNTISAYEKEGLALEPSMCGSRWDYIMSPGITTEDEVEFRLHNPHSHGNNSAYRDFLNTLYGSPNTSYILESYLKPYNSPPPDCRNRAHHRGVDAVGRGAGFRNSACSDGRQLVEVRPAGPVYGRLCVIGHRGDLLCQ